jgi:hypothetical protein
MVSLLQLLFDPDHRPLRHTGAAVGRFGESARATRIIAGSNQGDVTMKKHWIAPATALAMVTLAGCSGGDGLAGLAPNQPPAAGGGGTLPVTGNGRLLAVRLPATITSDTNSLTGLPQMSAEVTSVTATDRTAAGGVGVSGSVDEDPNPNNFQGSEFAPAVLVTASADGALEGGAAIIGLDKAKGNIFFENGNFGDPQAEAANAAISTVSVYNSFQPDNSVVQTVLKDVTTVRYRDGNAGDTEANFGVGYVGNPTASMPGSGTATYKGFYEQGVGAFAASDGTVRNLFISGEASLTADFAAGTVKGGVTGDLGTTNPDGTNLRNPNANVAGLAIDAKITGSEYQGTAALVNAAGATVGTVSSGNAIGGFFGANAAETAAAVAIEGNAEFDGVAGDYVLQGVLGAVKQ